MQVHFPRKIEDTDAMVEVLEKCKLLRIAFPGEPFPYILPMNYGISYENGKVVLYVHWQRKGKKLELLEQNTKVGFQVDWNEDRPSRTIHCMLAYESVVGGGELRIVEDEGEIVKGINCILKQYGKPQIKRYTPQLFADIYVLKLVVEEMSGKRM